MKNKPASYYYEAIASSLREFGYPGVTSDQIKEVHDALIEKPELVDSKDVSSIPHGVVGVFAVKQLEELWDHGVIEAPQKQA